MNYTKVSIETKLDNIEPINAILEDLGFNGIQIEGQILKKDYLTNDPSVIIDWNQLDGFSNSPNPIVSGFWPNDQQPGIGKIFQQLKQKISQLAEYGFDIDSVIFSQFEINEIDWENNWKPFYKPSKIDDQLYVVPSWEVDNFDLPKNAKMIILDPGMAFGTGGHQTTVLSLQLLKKYINSDDAVIDIGTGSGILTISAKIFEAKKVIATDIDQNSINVAKSNLEINNQQENVELFVSDLLNDVPDAPANLIIANILPPILTLLLPQLSKYLTDNGTVIFSGINKKSLQNLKNNIESNGFFIIEEKELDGWFGLVLKEKK